MSKCICFTTCGKRFDLNAAKELGNGTHRGQNDTTGTKIYKTASNAYILKHWSRWQGSVDEFEIIERSDAMNRALKHWSYSDVVAEFPEIEALEDEI